MKAKRKGQPRTKGDRNRKLLARVIVSIAILLCLFTLCLMPMIRDYHFRIDHIGLEIQRTQSPNVPPSRRERFPEAEIEYEELKQILFEVVDNTRIESLFEDTYIELSPPYCIVGKSYNSVAAKISFAEVIQRYKAWADQNGWHYEKIDADAGDSEANGKSQYYWHPRRIEPQQTRFEIEFLSDDSSSAVLNSSDSTRYHLRLWYIDQSCDID